MARALRIEPACRQAGMIDAVYHVTARGNDRKKIFFTKLDHEKFLDYIKEAKKKYGILVKTDKGSPLTWDNNKSVSLHNLQNRCGLAE